MKKDILKLIDYWDILQSIYEENCISKEVELKK